MVVQSGYLDNDQDYVKPSNWIVQHKQNFDNYPDGQFLQGQQRCSGNI